MGPAVVSCYGGEGLGLRWGFAGCRATGLTRPTIYAGLTASSSFEVASIKEQTHEPTEYDTPNALARPLRRLHQEKHGRGVGAGVQQPRRPARGRPGLHPEPAAGGLDLLARPLRRWRLHRRQHRPPRPAAAS